MSSHWLLNRATGNAALKHICKKHIFIKTVYQLRYSYCACLYLPALTHQKGDNNYHLRKMLNTDHDCNYWSVVYYYFFVSFSFALSDNWIELFKVCLLMFSSFLAKLIMYTNHLHSSFGICRHRSVRHFILFTYTIKHLMWCKCVLGCNKPPKWCKNGVKVDVGVTWLDQWQDTKHLGHLSLRCISLLDWNAWLNCMERRPIVFLSGVNAQPCYGGQGDIDLIFLFVWWNLLCWTGQEWQMNY